MITNQEKQDRKNKVTLYFKKTYPNAQLMYQGKVIN